MTEKLRQLAAAEEAQVDSALLHLCEQLLRLLVLPCLVLAHRLGEFLLDLQRVALLGLRGFLLLLGDLGEIRIAPLRQVARKTFCGPLGLLEGLRRSRQVPGLEQRFSRGKGLGRACQACLCLLFGLGALLDGLVNPSEEALGLSGQLPFDGWLGLQERGRGGFPFFELAGFIEGPGFRQRRLPLLKQFLGSRLSMSGLGAVLGSEGAHVSSRHGRASQQNGNPSVPIARCHSNLLGSISKLVGFTRFSASDSRPLLLFGRPPSSPPGHPSFSLPRRVDPALAGFLLLCSCPAPIAIFHEGRLSCPGR